MNGVHILDFELEYLVFAVYLIVTLLIELLTQILINHEEFSDACLQLLDLLVLPAAVVLVGSALRELHSLLGPRGGRRPLLILFGHLGVVLFEGRGRLGLHVLGLLEGRLAWEGQSVREVVLVCDVPVELLDGLLVEHLQLLEPNQQLVLEANLRRHRVAVDRQVLQQRQLL